ncbi:hypothetical protein O181_008757 [Austropuccinia psidii MF-1]|uniref:Uncharacterized protein n=1 Tax=Austropuccinia psidii MF-1 TaxID=1389203 RepID=A0A9Q3BPF0_9BASI|nr:hypothetical protein [Austropuccinia psidii MF-1]
MPCEQNLPQLTPGPSHTQWLGDLLPEPSKYNEPPIPGPSKSSKSQVPSHDDALPHEHDPEVAPTQSMEDCFAHPTTPFSITIIKNMLVSSPRDPSNCPQEPNGLLAPGAKLPSFPQ